MLTHLNSPAAKAKHLAACRAYHKRREEEKSLGGPAYCQHGEGRGVCGAPLDAVTDTLGRVVIVCANCERRKAGYCRDCPARVEGMVGRAIRCKECKRKRFEGQQLRYRRQNVDKSRARDRRRYQEEEFRKVSKERNRLWRLANPDKVKAQKRRSSLRGVNSSAKRRQRQRLNLHGPLGMRSVVLCVGCQAPVKPPIKKCPECKERDRLGAVQKLAALNSRQKPQ